ncbi:MAG: hypothetical protein MUP98_20140 [Candidatus Aminicenantes bacterium]|nr:hypothetical protein [Candidatus Aminicenantes bacterium]
MTGKSFSDLYSKGLLPSLIYLLLFILLTFPLILNFSSHFFADTGDGFTNIWNMWWINYSVTELHQLPWHTTFLHFPHGTSLLAHTLNPFNGFVGIGLLKFLTLTQAFNVMVLFSFVIGGLTAFLLAFYLSQSYWGSLLAGFIFTFSNYHFAHAEGHMQLVSLEWIPLFLLLWLMLMKKPSIRIGLAAALTLFGVLLCDYYYFFYCVITAVLITGWNIFKKKDVLFLLKKNSLAPISAFMIGLFATSGPLVIALSVFSRRNPLLGAHHPRVFSLDLLAPIIPGGHWRFESLTRFYWTKITGNFHESSVHLGLAVIFVLILVWVKRKKIREPSLNLWFFIFLFFLVLSLGPVLHIWGKEISWFKLPYILLEFIFPPLKLGGMPIRMMVMTSLSAGILFAFGFKLLWEGPARKKIFMGLLITVMCFEYLPRPMPMTRVDVPDYVLALKELPGSGGVLDTFSLPTFALYYQVVHGKPMAEGYIARIPVSVSEKNDRIKELLNNSEFELLYRGYHFRYLVTERQYTTSEEAPVLTVYDDGRVRIYDLGAAWE